MATHRWICRVALIALAALLGPVAVVAQSLRDMSTDRPDTTESAFTVDRGHVQVELSLMEWTRDASGGSTATAMSVLPFNVRWGVGERTELDFIVEPYGRERLRAGGRTLTSGSGFGDLTVRCKWNAWGNDGSPTAFALLPYLTLPTASGDRDSGHLAGGLALPYSSALAGGWGFSTMLVVDLPRNQENDGYTVDLWQTVSLGHDLGPSLGGYLELAGFWAPDGDQPYRATLNAGLTLGRGANAQLDAGLRLGLTDASDDLALFTGVSVRF